MALTEQSVIDSINVTAIGVIEVRTANCVLRDGVEISKTYHRHTLLPGSDLNSQDARVAAIASAAWTPETVEAYKGGYIADYEAKLAEANATIIALKEQLEAHHQAM